MSPDYFAGSGQEPPSGPVPRHRGRGSCLLAVMAAIMSGLIGAGIMAGMLLTFFPVRTTVTRQPTGTGEKQQNITIKTRDNINYAEAVAAKVTPSVVSVAIEQTVTDPLTGRTVTQPVGNGSGVIIRSDGYILTNDHVVAAGNAYTVSVGVSELPAKVVGRDTSSDLAVLKVDRTGLPAVEFGSSAGLLVGQPVVAIGSPFGLDQSVTTGVVSALGRSSVAENSGSQITAYTSLIQTDAAINPGNSGGALTDAEGRLVGINTLIQTGSQGVDQSAGIGFAIPIDYAKTIADELIKSGKATHPYLGVSSFTVSQAVAETYKLPVSSGALVDSVTSGSPAAKAGIKRGDIIVKIGDKAVTSVEDVFVAVRSHNVGDVVGIEFFRGSSKMSVNATLASDSAHK